MSSSSYSSATSTHGAGMNAALQQIVQKVIMRTEHHIQDMREDMYKYVEDRFQVAVRRSDDNALALVRGELKTRRADHHDAITRSEARVVELVQGILDQYDSATRTRQEQGAKRSQIVKRLRNVVVVAKTAAENRALFRPPSSPPYRPRYPRYGGDEGGRNSALGPKRHDRDRIYTDGNCEANTQSSHIHQVQTKASI
ncbi:hypothetical protein GN958_ATG22479 [Phytophthora infestans]|uniref:Uncharacterized protein n=1 Tax=Phytophthora infestans TaxID=4787 RepID=A0A8S9TJL5_PHYIN|nr:hypothetical protein GN958_ATG22479 [Phytophthora infestans]